MADNVISDSFIIGTVIQGVNITVQLPPRVTPALGVPAGSQAFTGRQAILQDMLAALAPGPQPSPAEAGAPVVRRAVAVAGMAGIGKTEAAIQAARLADGKGWFPGGVLFIDLHGYDPARCIGPDQALDELLRDLSIPPELIPPTPGGRARLYATVLESYAKHGRPVLVIIDNASSTEQARQLLPDDPVTGAIVTSRDSLGLLGIRRLDMDVLTAEEGMELLDRAVQVARPGDTRLRDHPDDARAIAELCAGLPQALEIVAAILADDPLQPPRAMVAALSRSSSRLAELRYQEQAIGAAFQLSYQRLDPRQKLIFRLLPVSPGPDISTESAGVLAELDETDARQGLAELARAHLLGSAGTYGRWRLHDLLRLYADERGLAQAGEDHREEARDRLLGYFLRRAVAANQILVTLPGMRAPDDFAGSDAALEWLDAERACLVAAVTMAADSGREKLAADLALAPATYLERRRRFDDALATATIARDIGRRLRDRQAEASALTNLTLTFQGLRRFDEAIDAGRAAAAIFEETGDRTSKAAALTNLGGALQQAGRFDEAIGVLREAADIYRGAGNPYAEAGVMINVGGAQRGARRFTQAIIALQTAATLLETFGDRRRQGIALTSLGAALHEVARFGEASTALRKAAEIFHEIPDRHGEGQALLNLGAVLAQAQQLPEAISASRDAIAAFQETGDPYGEAQAWINLATAQDQLNDPASAVAGYAHAQAIFRDTGDRAGEATALRGFGGTLLRTGQPDQAMSVFREAAGIFEEAGDRINAGHARYGLGGALMRMNLPAEGVAAFREAVTAFHDGGDQQAAAMAQQALDAAEGTVRQLDAAIGTLRDTASQLHASGDRSGESMALANLGYLVFEAGRFDEALAVLNDAVTVATECGNQQAEAIAQGNIGRTFARLGRLDDAIIADRAAAGLFGATGDRRAQAAALDNLGGVLREANRLDEAITAFEDAVASCQEIADQQVEAVLLQHLAAARAAQAL